ncbi:MAG: hypothetical protein RL153_2729, partial [Verrucomicrobiota bacterium]
IEGVAREDWGVVGAEVIPTARLEAGPDGRGSSR